ncbi:MAG: cation-translocating P-type ATPase [Verrucomicrobiota bacterium]
MNKVNSQDLVSDPYAVETDSVLDQLGSDSRAGLSKSEVKRRLSKYGSNSIRKTKGRSALEILIEQFRSVVVAILGAAAILAFSFGKTTEGVAILAVIIINCMIGYVSEWKAARSMEALRMMGKRTVRVRRNGEEDNTPSDNLVPGDICLHEGGDMISADLRLIEANNLHADESALTGESESVSKQTQTLDAGTVLAERNNMLYRGTTITEGSAVGVVVATGMQTELGHIAEMAEAAGAEEEQTPLERRLNSLGYKLAWVALGAAALVGAAGLATGKPTLLMIETAIALGVAAIPEGLPFVSTIGLARGMWLMARKQALINRLPAVETLGATNIILSDKTGTLTENRMTASVMVTRQGKYDLKKSWEDNWLVMRGLEIGVLCNNAAASDRDRDRKVEETQGDPTETALLVEGIEHGINRDDLLDKKPEVREVAFNSDTLMMATVHKGDKDYEFAVKGAPGPVIERCRYVVERRDNRETEMNAELKEEWNKKTGDLASMGLRVLALAEKFSDSPDADPYDNLRLVGLIGLLDPPREDVKRCIEACKTAGISVVMVTGDQPETAHAIARSLGLTDQGKDTVISGSELGDMSNISQEKKEHILKTRVFARVSPEQKMNLMSLFQEKGNTVAMTGDGVNDAPALKKADIGIAMGKRGTDAAKESADMILKNDAFSSILAAVEQGRIIFSNIRKAVIFMLCTNVAEVTAVGIASLADWPLPIRPLQILFLNVITDVFPALALSAGAGSPEKVMNRPPRPNDESVMGKPQWKSVSVWSAVMTACVLGALLFAVNVLGFDETKAVTVSFLTLGFAKLWFVLNLREPGSTIFDNDIVANKWMWGAIAGCVALLLAAVYLPALSNILGTSSPGGTGWTTILALSVAPMIAGQIHLHFSRQVA